MTENLRKEALELSGQISDEEIVRMLDRLVARQRVVKTALMILRSECRYLATYDLEVAFADYAQYASVVAGALLVKYDPDRYVRVFGDDGCAQERAETVAAR